MGPARRFVAFLARPFARRLELRIVALFLGLLLVVQMAGFVTIRHGIETNAHAQIDHELRTGENVLRRLLAVNAQSLAQASKVMAADFGFRSAIASGDRLTLADALDNHGSRVGAAVALFTDARHRLVASTLADPGPVLALVRAGFDARPALNDDSAVRMLDGQPFQLVTVAVRAPQLIGHVSMGFPVSAALLREVEQISGLNTGLLVRARGTAGWTVLPIGERGAALRDAAPALAGGAAPPPVRLDGESHAARIVGLAGDGAQEVGAVLLQSVDKAVAPYRRLQYTLLGITLLGIAVSALGSVATARNITRPIKALSASAERLGAGDYATPIAVASRDEVSELARSFEAMRVGMQQRDLQIRRLAYRDALTGLPNRARFRELLAEALARACADGQPCAVVMLNLDRFKRVNDVLGHAFGDRLLRQMAQRLTEGLLREDDVVARLGGDEFGVLLPRTDIDTAHAIAQRLRRALERPTTLDDQAVDVSAGMGVAVHPQHGADADTLLGRAELAMHAAKSRQAGVCVYEPKLDSSSLESLSLLTELRTAVDEDQLRLYLQPKVALASGRVLGAEALVRWQHPQRGMVSPMQFIPFAEQTGFIRIITGWMIDRCAARCNHLGAGPADLKFAINLSTRDLLDQDLPAKLERQFARGAMNPQSICLEITESAIMDDPQRAMQTLQRLHGMGLRLSIDDFGTGYSSLAYLKKLPVHELKIDRSFVMAMENDRADLKIVRSTIDLAHNLGLAVVAEGVENAHTWALLKALDCDEAQGYFMARPMPEAEFAGWLSDWALPESRLRTDFAALV